MSVELIVRVWLLDLLISSCNSAGIIHNSSQINVSVIEHNDSVYEHQFEILIHLIRHQYTVTLIS